MFHLCIHICRLGSADAHVDDSDGEHPDKTDDVLEKEADDSDLDEGPHMPAEPAPPSPTIMEVDGAALPSEEPLAPPAPWIPPPPRPLPDVPYPEHDLLYNVPGGGKIRFYQNSKVYEAVCPNVAQHGLCRITRRATSPRGKKKLTNPGQGRTVCFLIRWCKEHSQAMRELHKTHEPALPERSMEREALLDMPPGSIGWQMLGTERKLKDETHYNGEVDVTS